MATIERRNNRFRLIFYHLGRRYAASLKTTNEREADAIAGCVERTLQLLKQSVLAMPDGADLITFVPNRGALAFGRSQRPPWLCLSTAHLQFLARLVFKLHFAFKMCI